MNAMVYDKPVLRWAAWLPDGSKVEGVWESIPGPVCAVAVFYERPYSRVMYGREYIAKNGDSWGTSDDISELTGTAKEGKLVGDEEWEAIRLKVHEEADRWASR